MKKVSVLLLFAFLLLPIKVSAVSATIKATGDSYLPSNSFLNDSNILPMLKTVQISLGLKALNGADGISYIKIKIIYDNNILSCYGGAFYAKIKNIFAYPDVGHCSEYLIMGHDYYYEGDGYLTVDNSKNLYAINFRPKENIPKTGTTTVKFEVVSAKDLNGNDVSIATVSHTINLQHPDDKPKQDNNTSNGTNNNSKSTKETKKSNNAFLKTIDIGNNNLNTNFDKNLFEYSVVVPFEVDELNINFETENNKATTDVNGNKDLVVGENIVTILVKAEDGTKKEYKILVTKEAAKDAEHVKENATKNKTNIAFILISAGVAGIITVAGSIFLVRRKK